ncbi:hypothetical protein PYCCODRAFT_1374136 [Trametes coccinea BRFM310]|uniref:CCD97-like C-terminal domain-containing protein n=1 Tax=Trametes coccinea (strain BRFM310) TaxID=1353009 RepID=A0A1Y2ICS5_TRAC3|nr:hypothetical protein PYCCODRAFT_1374136 [Trametes coccinea BRFM310]
MSAPGELDPAPILKYLGLSDTYEPSPRTAPLDFLHRHLRELPPHLLKLFSANTTPKQRTAIPAIRNRRLKYTQSNPPEFSLTSAKSTWATLWEGRERPGREQAQEEKEWAEKEFLGDGKQQVGKLGSLLGEYEEERESERVRSIRRQRAEYIESLPEEDEESDDDESTGAQEPLPAETEEGFLRLIKERFIYGFLESIDYDKVDWDERWDGDLDRDAEERWFDDEEES